MNWTIPLFKIYHDEDDISRVAEVIGAGADWAVGPNVERFETMIGEYLGSPYCAVFNSGTSALHALMLAYGLGRGAEVIVPSFTFIATANSVLFTGGRPVFADIEEETCGLDPGDVQEKITRKTRAIMPIHFGGVPCKIEELRKIADDHGILLIEDAAEAFGASSGGTKAGNFGESSVLSFCQNKIITTGEGGAVVTRSQEVYEKLKLIRSHGRQEDGNYFTSTGMPDYVSLGYNFRMSNITAALGVAQIGKADEIIRKRRERAHYLTRGLRGVPGVTTPAEPDGRRHVFQMYTIQAEHRDGLMGHLADRGIMTKVYFFPVHSTHFYRDVLKYDVSLPVTEKTADRVLTLPIYPSMTGGEMDAIIGGIKSFYGGDRESG
jgi:perosamine synthetase